MKYQLPTPENWQDFETLCKKLWGEIWGIPNTIKKNGRNGQSQFGVDVYGIPKGELKYWGIQCKGKDQFSQKGLTESEIDKEIELAKKFKPELAVFIIATTAPKDVKIEEHVRKRNLENIANGYFEIHLFDWKDVSDLIEENRNTYNYYVNRQSFLDNYSFEIELVNLGALNKLNPKFFREIRSFKKGITENISIEDHLPKNNLYFQNDPLTNVNHAMTEIRIRMKNTGGTSLENWKVHFEIIGKHKYVNDSLFNPNYPLPNISYYVRKRKLVESSKFSYIADRQDTLIQEDQRDYTVTIIPIPEEYELELNWKLMAKDFSDEGNKKIVIEPVFEDKFDYRIIDDKLEEKIEILEIRENERPLKK